jgi:Conserved TM helix
MLDTIGRSLSDALTLALLAIPRIFAFVIILIIGWIIAGLLAGAVGALLRTIKFNDMATRAGITGFVQKMGAKTDPAGVLAGIVKWFIRLLALLVAFDALGLPAVSSIIRDFLAWLPNLVVALVIIVIAGLIANALGDLVRGAASQGGLGNPDLLAGITRVAVLGFGIIAAVNQVGIATTLVNTLFMGFVGALALALGLAFGLGGRDTAGEIVQGWYRQTKEAAPKMKQAAEAAKQMVENQAPGNMRVAPTPNATREEPQK